MFDYWRVTTSSCCLVNFKKIPMKELQLELQVKAPQRPAWCWLRRIRRSETPKGMDTQYLYSIYIYMNISMNMGMDQNGGISTHIHSIENSLDDHELELGCSARFSDTPIYWDGWGYGLKYQTWRDEHQFWSILTNMQWSYRKNQRWCSRWKKSKLPWFFW